MSNSTGSPNNGSGSLINPFNNNVTNGQHSGEMFKDIAEVFEASTGQCLSVRNDSIASARELGPPDLVNIIKSMSSSGKNNHKEISSYHFATGVDTSSSASIAAYVNSLTYSLEKNVSWMRTNPWKITKSTYCCYNAFSRVDMRVEARIPGGVSAYAINSSGVKTAATSDLWVETFVSAILRSIFSEDSLQATTFPALRKLDPMPTEIMERRFLEAAAKLFWNGPQISGSPTGSPTSSISNNFQSEGILRYFKDSGRVHLAKKFFDQFINKEVEITALIAKCLLLEEKEADAIKLLFSTLSINPNIPPLLLTECDFLQSKGNSDIAYIRDALEVAKQAVRCSPMDFMTWISFARCLLKIGDYGSALVALNTCPVSLAPEVSSWTLGSGTKLWLPPLKDNRNSDTRNSSSLERETVDITVMHSPPSLSASNQRDGSALEKLKAGSLKGAFQQVYAALVEIQTAIGWDELLLLRSQVFLMEEEFKQQQQQQQQQQVDAFNQVKEGSMEQIPLDESDDDDARDKNDHHETTTPFNTKKSKRLCERWLDGLFMVLFEDLRLHTLLQPELTSSVGLRTARDWLLFGNLCERLGKSNDAKLAYKKCIDIGFSRMAYLQLAKLYTEEGSIGAALNASIKMLLYDEANYTAPMNTSNSVKCIFRLIKKFGAEQIKMTMVGLKLGQAADRLLQKCLNLATSQKSIGFDY